MILGVAATTGRKGGYETLFEKEKKKEVLTGGVASGLVLGGEGRADGLERSLSLGLGRVALQHLLVDEGHGSLGEMVEVMKNKF